MTSQGLMIAAFGLAVLLAAIIVVAIQGPSQTRVGSCIALGFAWVMLLTSFVSLRIQRALRMLPKPPPLTPQWHLCRVCAREIKKAKTQEMQDPYVELAARYEAGELTLDRYAELLGQLARSGSGHPSPPSP